VVGWTDPEGSRPYLGGQFPAYHGPYGKLIYAGRAGTGIDTAELERLWRRSPPTASSLATSGWTMILRTHSIGLQPNGSAGLIHVEVLVTSRSRQFRLTPQIKSPGRMLSQRRGRGVHSQCMIFPPYGQPFFLFTNCYQCLRKSLVAGTTVNIPRRHQWRSCCRPPPLRLEY